MPNSILPKETQEEFVSRCIAEVLKDKSAKNPAQAAAICYNRYSELKKKKK